MRGKLVASAEQWRWCGLWRRSHRGSGPVLSRWPVQRPRNWKALVDAGLPEPELRRSAGERRKGPPLGSKRRGCWRPPVPEPGFTLRGPGRPRKTIDNQ